MDRKIINDFCWRLSYITIEYENMTLPMLRQSWELNIASSIRDEFMSLRDVFEGSEEKVHLREFWDEFNPILINFCNMFCQPGDINFSEVLYETVIRHYNELSNYVNVLLYEPP